MQTKIINNLKFFSLSIALGLVLGAGIIAVEAAWTNPPSGAPASNLEAPLNTSTIAQYKRGGLILNTGGATNGLIVQKGNVGIGTTTPGYLLDVVGGGIHTNKNLFVDGQVNAASASISKMTVLANGNIGIGTTTPGYLLDVVGGGIHTTNNLFVDANAQIKGLANCDTIDTDAGGNLKCGTDAKGGSISYINCTTGKTNSVNGGNVCGSNKVITNFFINNVTTNGSAISRFEIWATCCDISVN